MAIRATVQETTNEVFEAAEEKLGEFADKAYEAGRAQARHAVDEQKNAFKRFAMTIVRALRRGGDELRTEGYATVAGLVDDVATKAESMTDDVDDLDFRSATERAEDFVRERPLVAYGALAIAGFLVANTLQSAAQHRHQKAIAAERRARAQAKPAGAARRTASAARSTRARKPA
jgi:ElaB/YqjD/DUF883 family membrane-anchored ribosome-binding protein